MAELILKLSLLALFLWVLLVIRHPVARPFSVFPIIWLSSVSLFRVTRLYIAPDDITEIIRWRDFFNNWGNINTLLGIFFLIGIAGSTLAKGEKLWK